MDKVCKRLFTGCKDTALKMCNLSSTNRSDPSRPVIVLCAFLYIIQTYQHQTKPKKNRNHSRFEVRPLGKNTVRCLLPDIARVPGGCSCNRRSLLTVPLPVSLFLHMGTFRSDSLFIPRGKTNRFGQIKFAKSHFATVSSNDARCQAPFPSVFIVCSSRATAAYQKYSARAT